MITELEQESIKNFKVILTNFENDEVRNIDYLAKSLAKCYNLKAKEVKI